MPLIGLLRVKNEARWIDRVVKSIQPICERVIILDDHSDDGTPEICESLGAEVHRSTFTGIDESRDKDYLLTLAYRHVPERYRIGNHESPYWALLIDGDEELHRDDREEVKWCMQGGHHAYSQQVLYLWDTPNQVRVDGVYRTFFRPSLFRLFNESFRFQTTAHGRRMTASGVEAANFHCSSIPQELLHHARRSSVRLLHYGYMHREDRVRKYTWYNNMDPNNESEDGYRHMVIGDLFPADSAFRWGGPLKVEAI